LSEEHQQMTLIDLHLVPSGSLVVKVLPRSLPTGEYMFENFILTCSLNCQSATITIENCKRVVFVFSIMAGR